VAAPVDRHDESRHSEEQDPVPDNDPPALSDHRRRPGSEEWEKLAGSRATLAQLPRSAKGSRGAPGTGAGGPEAIEGVDPRPVAVAPADPDAVRAHQLDGCHRDVDRDAVGVE